MNELTALRSQIDAFMSSHPQSPLNHEQRRHFTGLNYYEANEAFSFVVDIDRFPEDEPLFEMETSTGEMRLYRRYGRISFQVNGEDAQLTIYSDPHGQDFFLPYRDATSGKDTYGAGRYMDNHRPALKPLANDQFQVDFNFAYNPYCAYNPHYSCPLPPRENWLSVAIEAGEKNFT